MFALLGLACDALDPEFSPDYVAPIEDIVQQYARGLVERGSAMELLYRSGSTARFPLWTPDWATTTHRRTTATWRTEPHGSFLACSRVGVRQRYCGMTVLCWWRRATSWTWWRELARCRFRPWGHMSYLREIWRFIESCDLYPSGESFEDLARIPIGNALAPTPSAEDSW